MLMFFIIFIFGTLIGSFISVVVERWEEPKSILLGRSRCNHCRKDLAPWQMIPIISWMIQLGRCAFCKNKISYHYPLLEIITGLLFVFFAYQFIPFGGNILDIRLIVTLFFYFVFIAGLVAIFEIDRKTMYIPDVIVFPIIILFFLGLFFDGISVLGGGPLFFLPIYHNLSAITIITGMLVGGGLFGAIAFFSKGKWMGWGDVKLGLLIGLFLGPRLAGIAIYLAIISGGLYGLVMLLTKRYKKGDMVPFGPFLVIGSLIALFWGYLMTWFLGLAN